MQRCSSWSFSIIKDPASLETHTGPLPSPEILARYEHVLPGSAERIFSVFEKQAEHRSTIETVVIPSNAFSQRLGGVTALFVVLIGMGGSVWLAHDGHALSSLATAFVTVGSILGTFVVAKKQQSKELADKREDDD